MAITNTSKSKEFVAGSSPIILKGDYRPTKMASAPDPRAELNQMALNMFGKELRLLTEDEMDQVIAKQGEYKNKLIIWMPGI